MKGLILKDLFNLSKNIKLLLGMIVIFAVAFTAAGMDNASYIVLWGMLLSMQVITSFSFDEMSKWTPFAMTMPVTRKEYIRSKFLLHLLLVAGGHLVSLAVCLGSMAVMHTITAAAVQSLMMVTLPGIALTLFTGGASIPLLLKFGAERSRILSILLCIIPACIGISLAGAFDPAMLYNAWRYLVGVLYAAPVLALIWEWGMYLLSCRLFAQSDLTA